MPSKTLAEQSDLALETLENFTSSRSGNPADLQRARDLIIAVLKETPDTDPARPRRLNLLGLITRTEYNYSKNPKSLSASIDALLEATKLPADDSVKSQIWNNLRIALEYRYDGPNGRSLDDLEAAITANENVLKYCQDRESLSINYNNLSQIRRRLFERNGDLTILNQSIQDAKNAISNAIPDDPYLPVYYHNLGIALQAKWTTTKSDMQLLEELLACRKHCTELPCSNADYRHLFLNSHAVSLRARFNVYGEVADLDEALSIYRQILETDKISTPDQIMCRNNLAIALHDKFKRVGDIDDLNTGIKELYEAVKVARNLHDEHDTAMSLSNISILLATRFEYTGAIGDLVSTVDSAKSAVDLEMMNPRSRLIFSRLLNYANALKMKYLRTEDPADLDRSIDQYEAALKYSPEGSSEYVSVANNLGAAFRLRYDDTTMPDPKDLDGAIKYHEIVISTSPEHSIALPRYLHTFALALLARYKRDGSIDDLTDAIALTSSAIDKIDSGSAAYASYCDSLGEMLLRKYRFSDNPQDLEEAVRVYKAGVDVESAPTTIRIEIGQRGAILLEGLERSEEALQILEKCLEILPETSTRASDFIDQQRRLASIAGLGSDAAALALKCNRRLDVAVSLLEAGRGVIVGRLLDLRTDLNGLPKEMRDEYERLRAILDPPFRLDVVSPLQNPGYVDMAHRAASDFKTLRDQIRKIPGFENFERSLSTEEMKALAKDPIVSINVNARRCDAFVFGVGEVRTMQIEVTLSDIESQVSEFQTLLKDLTNPEIGMYY